MLVVLAAFPGATPGEAVLFKETVAEVAAVNLVGNFLLAVGIFATLLWLNNKGAI